MISIVLPTYDRATDLPEHCWVAIDHCLRYRRASRDGRIGNENMFVGPVILCRSDCIFIGPVDELDCCALAPRSLAKGAIHHLPCP